MLLILIVFLPSCSSVGKYRPDPKFATGVVESINISNAVKLTNSQPSTFVHSLNFEGIEVDYNSFTQSLVDALKIEYERNNVLVTDIAEKELSVSVTGVSISFGYANFRSHIIAEVKYGDDVIEKFETSRATVGSLLMVKTSPTKPLNVAFRDLVEKIIMNKKIQNYINQIAHDTLEDDS